MYKIHRKIAAVESTTKVQHKLTRYHHPTPTKGELCERVTACLSGSHQRWPRLPGLRLGCIVRDKQPVTGAWLGLGRLRAGKAHGPAAAWPRLGPLQARHAVGVCHRGCSLTGASIQQDLDVAGKTHGLWPGSSDDNGIALLLLLVL